MHVIYIWNYMKDGVMIGDRLCIYDKRSPSDDIKCLEPIVNLEDSKAGSLSITLPLSHMAYDYIVKGKTMVSVYRLDDDPNYENNLLETLIFEGPVRKDTIAFNKDKNLYVEGFFSFLNETIQPRREFFGVTLNEFMSALISTHNERMADEPTKQFVLGTVEINYPDVDQKGSNKSEYESTNFGTTMEYFLSIQEQYGGHYIFSKENGKYRIDYVRNLPKNEDQEITFGENLLDLINENDLTDICSAVVPISSVSGNSLGTAGEVIVSTDLSRIPSRYHVKTDDADEGNRQCWGVYENWNTPNQRILAYIYDGRGLKQKDGDDTRGAYDIGDYAGSNTGYHLVRCFVTDEFDRLYFSSRADTGGFNGFWCYYAYNHATDLLDYQELSRNDSSGHPELWNSIHDYEFDLSYTSAGQKHYTDRSNNSVGELLLRGFGSGIPTEVKAPKYSYASDPEIGDILITYGYVAEGFSGQISYHSCLYRNSNDDNIFYFDLATPDPNSLMCIVELSIPPEGDPLRDFDALMITTRTKVDHPGEGYESYTGDCLYALYYGTTPMYMLGYERASDDNVFTSVINYKIDLKAPENVGADRIMVMCYGLRAPGSPDEGEAPIVPIIRKCKKYVGKTTEYLTVEGADPNEYHDAGSLVVKDDALVAKYGYSEKRLEFSGIEDPNVLEKRSEAYLHDTQFGNVRIDARAIDLHDSNVKIEALDISTSVRCFSYPHNLNRFFEIKSLTLNLDYPLSNSISLAEENEGYYKGLLPASVLTTTNQLRKFKIYGTVNGLFTPGSTPTNDIQVTIHNLITNKSQTITITRTDKLVYPDYVSIGVNDIYSDFDPGLIEISTTSMDHKTGEYPIAEFYYDKTKDSV